MNEELHPHANICEAERRLDLLTRKVSLAVDRMEILNGAEPLRLPRRGNPNDQADRAGAVRGYLRARRLREKLLPPDLFAEPAWDIILDLYAAGQENKIVSVSSACIAAVVPTTTAMRWLRRLIECGLVEKIDDELDGRRANVQLTALGEETVGRWVEMVLL